MIFSSYNCLLYFMFLSSILVRLPLLLHHSKKKIKKSMNKDKNNLFRSINNDTEGSSGSGSLL